MHRDAELRIRACHVTGENSSRATTGRAVIPPSIACRARRASIMPPVHPP